MLSAIGMVGSKEEPTSLGDETYIFADNVLAELNSPPATGLLPFIARLQKTLKLAALHLYPNRLMIKSSLEFPPSQMEDLRAFIIGCTPEYNAWNLDSDGLPCRVPPPFIRPGNNFRSCGGHIHIGCSEAVRNPVRLVRALDLFVGITNILIDHDSTSKARRKIYGGAGNFRSTNYGIEYRTPSVSWLASPAHAMVIYLMVDAAIRHFERIIPEIDWKDIVNAHDHSFAEAWWNDSIRPILEGDGSNSLIATVESLMVTTPKGLYESWGIKVGSKQVVASTN